MLSSLEYSMPFCAQCELNVMNAPPEPWARMVGTAACKAHSEW
jgi:hypothetical protein